MEERCWICKRSEKELVQWAEKKYNQVGPTSGVLEVILGSEKAQMFESIAIGENETIVLCPVCSWLITELSCYSEAFKDALDGALKRYKVFGTLDYSENES